MMHDMGIKFNLLRDVAIACMSHIDPIAYYAQKGKMSLEVSEYELSNIVKIQTGNDLCEYYEKGKIKELFQILNDYLNKEAIRIAFNNEGIEK